MNGLNENEARTTIYLSCHPLARCRADKKKRSKFNHQTKTHGNLEIMSINGINKKSINAIDTNGYIDIS